MQPLLEEAYCLLWEEKSLINYDLDLNPFDAIKSLNGIESHEHLDIYLNQVEKNITKYNFIAKVLSRDESTNSPQLLPYYS